MIAAYSATAWPKPKPSIWADAKGSDAAPSPTATNHDNGSQAISQPTTVPSPAPIAPASDVARLPRKMSGKSGATSRLAGSATSEMRPK